jgi:hypothetical protein
MSPNLMEFKITVLRDVTFFTWKIGTSILENLVAHEGNVYLQSIGTVLPNYMMLHPRGPQS